MQLFKAAQVDMDCMLTSWIAWIAWIAQGPACPQSAVSQSTLPDS